MNIEEQRNRKYKERGKVMKRKNRNKQRRKRKKQLARSDKQWRTYRRNHNIKNIVEIVILNQGFFSVKKTEDKMRMRNREE